MIGGTPGNDTFGLTPGSSTNVLAVTVNGVSQAGAVYLFNGTSCELISTLSGSLMNEVVGGGGVVALSTGSFVVPGRRK